MLRPVCLVLAFLLAAAPAWGGGPVQIVTTSTDLKALVEAVGGDRVRVTSLAPAIHAPHQVDVRPSQLADLRSAALLVRIGLDHEPWLARVLRTVNEQKFTPGFPNDLDVSRGIVLLQSETARVRSERGVHVHGFGNTHYWLDPDNAHPMTRAILAALTRLDPASESIFDEQRARFLARLDAGLARWTQAMAPYRGTRVVTVHETWPYFARRFGLVIAGALEPTPGVPPSPSHLALLVQRMRETKVPLLLASSESDLSVANQVSQKSGARTVILVASVGADPAVPDYVSLFDVNVGRLTEALTAP